MYYKALAMNFTELHNYKQPAELFDGAESALSFQLLSYHSNCSTSGAAGRVNNTRTQTHAQARHKIVAISHSAAVVQGSLLKPITCSIEYLPSVL